MVELFETLVKFQRFNRLGKERFIKFILDWSKDNLNNYKTEVQYNRFIINYRELVNCILLTILLVATFIMLLDINISFVIKEIIILLLVYLVQFKTIFLVLGIIYNSKNVVLSKNNNSNNNIIICAHYDTKNCLLKGHQNILYKTLKRNIYNVSRLLVSKIFGLGKYAVVLSILIAIYYVFFHTKNAAASIMFYDGSYFNITYELLKVMMETIILTILLILILSLSYTKKMNNIGADDNTSGVLGVLSIAKLLNESYIDANINIVLFDNEEKGLIGSNHYVSKNIKNKSKNTYVINLDCIGRGEKIYINCDNEKNNIFLDGLKNILIDSGKAFKLTNIDYSDHKSFGAKYIKAFTIGRYDEDKFLWYRKFPQIDWIHGNGDNIIFFSKVQDIIDVVITTINIYFKR